MNVGWRVTCPVCGAICGTSCVTLDDGEPTEAHKARRELEEANAAEQAKLDAEHTTERPVVAEEGRVIPGVTDR